MRCLFFIVFFIHCLKAQCQTLNESLLDSLGKIILSEKQEAVRIKANQAFDSVLYHFLIQENAFEYDIKYIGNLSYLKSDDKKLKIYNWAFPQNKGTYKYFAYLLYKTDDNAVHLIKLEDVLALNHDLENKSLDPKNWYGCLYYDVIYNKNIGEGIYTLLGWDGNNLLSNKKVIDVIKINRNGLVQIGVPIIKVKNHIKKRLIFEYAEECVMSLKYHPKLNKIVFDDLVPMSEQFTGIYEYYAPNLHTFNALIADKNKWIFEADTKITQPKTIKDRFYHNPNPELNKGY